MSTLNDIDVGLPMVGASLSDLANEIRNLKTIVKNVLLVAHTESGSIDGAAIASVADASISTAKLQDGAVTSAKLANGSVLTINLADGNVTSGKLAAGLLTSTHFSAGCIPFTAYQPASIPMSALQDQITNGMYTDGSISTNIIADNAITDAKIAGMSYTKLMGTATVGQTLIYTALGWAPGSMPTLPSIDVAMFGARSPGDGGNLTVAAQWNKRSILEFYDSGNVLSIASGDITLEPGNYFFFARANGHECGNHQLRLVKKKVSDSTLATIAIGSVSRAYAGTVNHVQTDSTLFHVFTVTDSAEHVYYLEHYLELVAEADDLGVDANTGEDNLHVSGYLFRIP